VAAALIVGVIAGRLLPAPDPMTHPPAAVAALTHEQTLARVPRLIAGKLTASQSRAVVWHLAHCDECFEVYERTLGARQRQSGRPAMIRVAQSSPAMIDRAVRWVTEERLDRRNERHTPRAGAILGWRPPAWPGRADMLRSAGPPDRHLR
jgi:hypothetical protein